LYRVDDYQLEVLPVGEPTQKKQGKLPSANVFKAAEQMAPAVTCCWK